MNDIELAKIEPSLVLAGDKPRLIDEWQEDTNLWDEIRYDVDRTGLKGQYILTGSSTPKKMVFYIVVLKDMAKYF